MCYKDNLCLGVHIKSKLDLFGKDHYVCNYYPNFATISLLESFFFLK